MHACPVTLPRTADPVHLRDDEQLLLDVRAGEDEAYGEIYRRYAPQVRGFARSLVGGDEVDDVVADAFTKVLHALRAGNGPVTHPVRYLMVAVRSAANDHRARQAKDRNLAGRLSRNGDPVVEEADDLYEDDQLVIAFRSLAPRWRQVIWWSEIEGRPPIDIGRRLGISAGAAAALAYRARRALRDAYLGDDALDPT